MALTEKQLAQARPANTSNTQVYSPPASTTGVVVFMTIANTTASPALARVFHDDDGTTYDESTALIWDLSIAANTTVYEKVYWPVDSAGNLAVRTSVASALTFTFGGVEVT